MHVVRQYDPGIDMKRKPRQPRSHCIAQCCNFDHQQVRAPVSEINREEIGAAWYAVATIIRYCDILLRHGGLKVRTPGIVVA